MVVAVVTVVSRFLLPQDEQALLRGDAPAALSYVANWRMILRGTDYFTQTASPSLLQHTWSLGIEERFYLLWSVVVLALLRWTPVRQRRVALFAVVGGGVIASVASGWLLPGQDANLDRAYFGSDSRAVSILLGCSLAVAPAEPVAVPACWQRVCGVAALGGALVTGWTWVHADGTDPWIYRGGLLLAALGGRGAGRLRPRPRLTDCAVAVGAPAARPWAHLLRRQSLALAALHMVYVAAVGASTWSGPCGRLHDCGSSAPRENGAAVIEDL